MWYATQHLRGATNTPAIVNIRLPSKRHRRVHALGAIVADVRGNVNITNRYKLWSGNSDSDVVVVVFLVEAFVIVGAASVVAVDNVGAVVTLLPVDLVGELTELLAYPAFPVDTGRIILVDLVERDALETLGREADDRPQRNGEGQ